MTHRTARRILDRDQAGAIDFDAALEQYLAFADDSAGEDLLCAAALVVGSTVPID